MSSLCALCSSCAQYLNDYKDVYCITKCGHVYHGQCLRKISYKGICTICHTLYDARQCHKLKLSSKSNNEDDSYPYEYDWMYCDHKTNFEQQDVSKCYFKLGTDFRNDDIYAARAFLNGNMLPAYYIPARKCAITTFGGHAYELNEDIDLLDTTSDNPDFYEWVKYENDKVPENALDITEFPCELLGSDADIKASNKSEEKLYIARGDHKGKMLYGKLCSKDNDNSNQIYLAFGSEEIKVNMDDSKTCEVLVRNSFM